MNYQFCLLLILIAIASLALAIKQTRRRRQQLPPSPWKLPIVGNLPQLLLLASTPYKSIQQLSRKYGPLMFLQLGSLPTLIVSSADAARAIFKPHDAAFSGRPTDLHHAKYISYDFNAMSFAPYHTLWKELRKIAASELLGSKTAKSFRAAREEEVASMLDRVAGLSMSGAPINLSQLLRDLTSNVICRITFGKSSCQNGVIDTTTFCTVVHEALDMCNEFVISDMFPWLRWVNKVNGVEERVEKKYQELDKFYDRVIEDHLLHHHHDDENIVDSLLRLQKDPSQAITLTDQHVKGFLTDIFVGGIDTITTTLVWAVAELIRNPSMMERAQAEVRQVAKGRRNVEETDLPKLTYLYFVIKETLRLHSAFLLSLPRETTQDCAIGDYTIPAKTMVILDIRSIGTDPKYWENPNEFRPDRFLNSSVDVKGQQYELLPFGVGRRGCPGTNFALLLIPLALANLLHRFDWELPYGMRIEDVDMEEETNGRTMKKTPLHLVARPRTIPSY